MTSPDRPRILVVDDEEAILETISFTFMDDYDVTTSVDARLALEILDEQAPFAVVITDQRMPGMTGVEMLAEAFERHPQTVRIMLTGFADTMATIQAINDSHVYAYINKPWETEELKHVVAQAVERYQLATENVRLLRDLQNSNSFLEAVMDRLQTGAIAVDADGVVRAANRPARDYLALTQDPRGEGLREILARDGLEGVGAMIESLMEDGDGRFEEVDLGNRGGSAGGEDAVEHRLRVSAQTLTGSDGAELGRVILFKEVSHEPLRRRFDTIVSEVSQAADELRPRLEAALSDLRALAKDVAASGIASPSMAELSDRASRSQTAVQNWLDVDDRLAGEDYPDAQMLVDRMRVAGQRWPRSDKLPERVHALAKTVEAYYESGENPRQRVL
jgi:CheY-like chemotaxis protein